MPLKGKICILHFTYVKKETGVEQFFCLYSFTLLFFAGLLMENSYVS